MNLLTGETDVFFLVKNLLEVPTDSPNTALIGLGFPNLAVRLGLWQRHALRSWRLAIESAADWKAGAIHFDLDFFA